MKSMVLDPFMYWIGDIVMSKLTNLNKKRVILTTIVIFVFLAFIISCINMYILARENQDKLRQLVKNEQVLLDSESKILSSYIDSTIYDLLYLSTSFEAQRVENKSGYEMAREWQAFADNKHLYDQIRFIDQNGNEKIRINYFPGGSVVVPDSQLQNKKDRYYFTETAKLAKGQIFISRFDLNIENNQVEKPDKPMIRFATPLYDRNNAFQGIIILNYYGKYLISLMDDLTANSQGNKFLLNSEGYWIYNNQDQSLAWSFMYDEQKNISFKHTFANEWDVLQSAESGQFKTGQGYFIFRKIIPIQNEMNGTGLQKTSVILAEDSWTIVSFIPRQGEFSYLFNFSFTQYFDFIVIKRWSIHVVFLLLSFIIGLLYQINQQSRAEVKKSRDDLLKFASQVPGMLYQYEITSDGKVRVPFTTDAIQDIFGCKPEDVREDFSPVGRVIHPADVDRINAAIAESVKNLSAFQLEYRVVLPGQPVHWVLAKSMPEKKEDGTIIFHGFNTDITRLKEIEAQLRDREERFRLLFSTSLDAILMTRPNGEILEANPAAEQLFERSEAELRQSGRTGVVDSNDPRLPLALKERRRTGVFKGELNFLHRDGTAFPTELVSTIFTDSYGEEKISMFIRDITSRKQVEDLLKKERELFNTTLMSVEEGIVMARFSGEILVFNSGAERITGHLKEEVLNQNIDDVFHFINVNTRESAHDYLLNMLRMGKQFDTVTDLALIAKDGTVIRISASIALIKGSETEEDRIIASFRDIRKEYELEKQIEGFLNVNLDMLCVIDLDGNFIKVNHKFEEILGYTSPEIEGSHFMDFVHEDDAQRTLDALSSLGTNKNLTGFVNRYHCKDGSYKYIEWNSIPGLGNCLYTSARDVTAKKKYEEKLQHFAIRDELTALYNRHYFDAQIVDVMEHSDRYDQPLSFLIFDLDHFKNINDTFGHAVGDEVLITIARTAEKLARDSDLVFRLGGEEFLILMPQTPIGEAVIIAETLRATLEHTSFPVIGQQTISIGVSERMKSESYRHWFRRTDEALYRAKQNGRNRVETSDYSEKPSLASVRIHWKPEWESGDVEIDRQHTELIELANQLLAIFLAGATDEEIISKLDLFLDHIAYHFNYEEVVIRIGGYPESIEHGDIHKSLIAKAFRLKKSFINGEVKASAFFSFIIDDVILDHLVKYDTKFFPYMKK